MESFVAAMNFERLFHSHWHDKTMNLSRSVDSNQNDIHPRLAEVVERHRINAYRKPVQDHNLAAFEKLTAWLAGRPQRPLILDSCCGTGMSTLQLARQFPQHWVIGLDRSEVRLGKNSEAEEAGCLLLRGNCEDIWRLCVEADLSFQHHFVLYPNPYPKSEHLQRRWHGHPVFPLMPQLAQRTVLRSNWLLYLQEFACAWEQITSVAVQPEVLHVDSPISLFEKKYRDSGQLLYQLTATAALPAS